MSSCAPCRCNPTEVVPGGLGIIWDGLSFFLKLLVRRGYDLLPCLQWGLLGIQMTEAREEGAQGSLNGKTGTRASPLASEAGLNKNIHSFIQNVPWALSVSQCCAVGTQRWMRCHLCSPRSQGWMQPTGWNKQNSTAQLLNTREACAGVSGTKRQEWSLLPVASTVRLSMTQVLKEWTWRRKR